MKMSMKELLKHILNHIKSEPPKVTIIRNVNDFVSVANDMDVDEVRTVWFASTFMNTVFSNSYQNYGGYMFKHNATVVDGFGCDAGAKKIICFRGDTSTQTFSSKGAVSFGNI